LLGVYLPVIISQAETWIGGRRKTEKPPVDEGAGNKREGLGKGIIESVRTKNS